MNSEDTLVEVIELSKHFSLGGEELVAVLDVSFSIPRGETLGLVGESGSGKTTIGLTLAGLISPTAGVVRFDGVDLNAIPRQELRRITHRIQMVFQDPREALDPRMRMKTSIAEPLRVVHPDLDRKDAETHVEQAAKLASFSLDHLHRYPHQLSAGEQQRGCLARALVARPDFVVLDEPTSMLDASLRAGMIHTFSELQRTLNLTYLMISHDIVSVAALSSRIAVIYLGKIVEIGSTEQILVNPLHPYTRALLSAIPMPRSEQTAPAVELSGPVPSPIDRPSGCPLATRCPYVEQRCREEEPELEVRGSGHHRVSCFVVARCFPRGEWEPVETSGRWLADRLGGAARGSKNSKVS